MKSYQTAAGYAIPNGTTANYYYQVKDWLGTAHVTLDAAGAIKNAMDYYPYGKKLPGRNAFSTNQEGYRYQFTGHEFDGETGYQYHGARYYNEELARYMSVDPWADKYPNWSTYNYVVGNPNRFIDPNGKGPTDWFVNKQTGTVIYIAGESKVTQEALDKMGSKYSVDDYKRLGDDNMFGKNTIWPTEGVVRDENNEVKYAAFGIASYLFMQSKDYVQAQEAKVEEKKFSSGGRMGPGENVTSTTYTTEEIAPRELTWAKEDNLMQPMKIETDIYTGSRSSITTVTYTVLIEAWSEKINDSIYFGGQYKGDALVSGANVLAEIVKAITGKH